MSRLILGLGKFFPNPLLMKVEIDIDACDEILIGILQDVKNNQIEFWSDEPEYSEKLKEAVEVLLDYFGAGL
ncbi:hypothetical protein LCGC14_2221840 [marine sediment metagenome]|uniref:Uncharacterized protein n=1 Tax=marine sediment metagenome TaxID=412755 RepID=A0A0F9G697_9ZZZZ